MPKKNKYNPYSFKSKVGFKPTFNDLTTSTFSNEYTPMMFKNINEVRNHNDLKNLLLAKQKNDFKGFTNAGALISDVAVLGNYIPHPAAQMVGKAGIFGSAIFNGAQTINSLKDGDYLGAGLNAGAAIVPMALPKLGYLRAGENVSGNSIFRKIIQNPRGSYRPLTTLANKIAPATIKGINYNRAVLGSDVAAIGFNSFGNGGKNDFYTNLLQTPKPKIDNVMSMGLNDIPIQEALYSHINSKSKSKILPKWKSNIKTNPIESVDVSNTDMHKNAVSFYNDWLNSSMFDKMSSVLPSGDKRRLVTSFDPNHKTFFTNDSRLVDGPTTGVNINSQLTKQNGIPKGSYLKKGMDVFTNNTHDTHELSHQYDDNGNAIPFMYNDIINKTGLSNTDYQIYIGHPTETRARLMELRRYGKENKVYDPFVESANKTHLEKMKNHPAFKELRMRYNSDEINMLLNTIAKNNTSEPTMALNGIGEDDFFKSPYNKNGNGNYGMGLQSNPFDVRLGMSALSNNRTGFEMLKSSELELLQPSDFSNNAYKFNLRDVNAAIDGLTAINNTHTDYQNRRDELSKLAELFQNPSNNNFDRYGKSSPFMYFKNGGYVVQEGDTISAIAKKHNIDPKTILANNKISNPNYIKTGQVLNLGNNDILKTFMPGVKPISSKPKISKSISVVDQLKDLSNNNPVVMHYGQEMINNGNRLLLTDKGSKTTYYVNSNNQVVSIRVGTGFNDDPKRMTRTLNLKEQFAAKNNGDLKSYADSKITPVGRSAISYSDDIYGSSGLLTTNPAFQAAGTLHQIYPGDYANRIHKMNTPSVKDNNISYGCTNCMKSDLDPITALYGHRNNNADSIYNIDSRVPISENQKGFDANAYLKPKGVFDNLKSYLKFENGGDTYWRNDQPMPNDPSMDAISKVLLQRNMNQNFIQRAAGFGYQGSLPSSSIPHQDANSNNRSNLLMGFDDNNVFPTIMQTSPSQLSYQPNQSKEYLQAPSWDVADYFSTKGYKRAANDMYKMKYKNGGGEKEIQGLPFNSPLASAVVEKGEAVQFGNQDIAMVADDGPYIEDHGDKHDGTYLPDVRRVLENTSTKDGRNHKSDMLLAMDADSVEAITGFRPKGKRSHAQAYDEAVGHYKEALDNIANKKEKVNKMKNLSETQLNALRLNDMFGAMQPTNNDLFDSLFAHQEDVKMKHGISNDEPLKFKRGADSATAILNDKLNHLGWPGNSGYQDWLKNKLANNQVGKAIQNGKKPIVFKPSIKSTNTPISSNNFEAIQTAPLNISGVGAGDNPQYDSRFGNFIPPFTDGSKPNWYDNSNDVWNQDIYPYTQQYMGWDGPKSPLVDSPHAQYQNFIGSKYGDAVVDAYRNGIMPLNNSHMQLAATLGIDPKDLNNEQIIQGYKDDKQNVRGIMTQRVTDAQGRSDIKSNYRPVQINGKTMYVEQTPDINMPVTYYDIGDEMSSINLPPHSVRQNQTNEPVKGNLFSAKQNETIVGNPTPMDNNGQKIKTNSKGDKVPLEWYDIMGPMAGLVNASGRYPEMPFSAEVNQLEYNLLDPQAQFNAITSQTRPALRDASNDSVGQALKAQLLVNANKAKSDVLASIMNANSQILNQETDYNTAAKDKQSVMNATSAQDFSNRMIQSKSKQDEAITESVDAFAKMFADNKQFNTVLNMLDTNNFTYDANSKGIAFNGKSAMLNGMPGQVSADNPFSKNSNSKRKLSPSEFKKLEELKKTDPTTYMKYKTEYGF